MSDLSENPLSAFNSYEDYLVIHKPLIIEKLMELTNTDPRMNESQRSGFYKCYHDLVPQEPTLEERIALAKTSLQSMFNSRADKRFYDYGGVTYDFIKRNELLPLSKSLVEEAMKYGKKEQLKKSRNSAYKDALIGGNKNLNDAREKKEAMIRSYARTYVVRKWLNSFDDDSFAKFLEKVDRNMI